MPPNLRANVSLARSHCALPPWGLRPPGEAEATTENGVGKRSRKSGRLRHRSTYTFTSSPPVSRTCSRPPSPARIGQPVRTHGQVPPLTHESYSAQMKSRHTPTRTHVRAQTHTLHVTVEKFLDSASFYGTGFSTTKTARGRDSTHTAAHHGVHGAAGMSSRR